MEDLWNKYRIHTNLAAQTHAHLEGSLLVSGGKLTTSLHTIQTIFSAPDAKTTASLFIKRYCAYIAVLDAMSRRNMDVSLALSHVSFSCSATHIFTYAPAIAARRMKQHRNTSRDEILQALFQNHLSVIIAAFERETRFSSTLMWAHVAYYIHAMYKKWIEEEQDIVIKERLLDDLSYIQKASKKWLGIREQNLLCTSFSTMEHPIENKEILIRKACCLNYKTGHSKGACYTCPRLTEQERIDKLQTVYTKA